MKLLNALPLFLALATASAFSSPATISSPQRTLARSPTQLFESAEDLATSTTTTTTANIGVPASKTLPMPQSYSEMVRQVAQAMRDAYDQNIDHQIVRVCLPRDSTNANLGVFSEGLLDVDSQDIVLVPPDESWQGGIMQLYYSAAPTMSDALRLFTQNDSGVPPRIEEDRSVDESGVDGVGLLKADLGEDKTVRCFIQPSQETVEDHVDAEAQKPGMVLLLNPQWRVTDDWFDGVSRTNTGLFGQVAEFLGGKGGTLRRLGELNFESVYNLEGYVCRGWNVRMVKRFDSDYTVYVEGEIGSYTQVGTKNDRPTYQDVEKMLDDRGFGYRYTEGLI